ncbi:MAG: response regulator [Proteobacteria bacterium]|nr:response regulator [Pseudomonadota bacterium]
MHILLIEDMDSDAELIRLELLGEWPMLQLDWANTRQALSQALAKPAPDLVLCDSRLPGLHGADILERVAAAWPGMPLVFCVGSPDGDPILQRVLSRAAGLVDKNTLHTLAPTIKRALAATRPD